jgi:hypothetical protein
MSRSERPGPEPYDTLREHLHDLRWRAGNPSYRRLGALWRRTAAAGGLPVTVFAPATIADNLNGRRRAMAWPFVRFFVASCVEHAGRVGIPLRPEDTRFENWHALWLAQAPALRALPGCARPPEPPVRLNRGSIPPTACVRPEPPATMGVRA